MSNICEHEFEARDRKDERYSLVEFDLAAKLNMTIRKNFETNRYEIVTIPEPREVVFNHDSLDMVVKMANYMENNGDAIKVGCGLLCPEKMRRQ